MTEILNWIIDSIRAHGPWSVFVGVIIESVIVPIPSPLIIMGAGFLLISAELSFLQAFVPIITQIVLPGSIASTLGAYIGYAIGYVGGKPMVERLQGFLGFNWSDVEAMERRFRVGQVNTSLFFLRIANISTLSNLRRRGTAPASHQTVHAVDLLWLHRALPFSGIFRLGARRTLPSNGKGHR